MAQATAIISDFTIEDMRKASKSRHRIRASTCSNSISLSRNA
jgi:hypothetical protein